MAMAFKTISLTRKSVCVCVWGGGGGVSRHHASAKKVLPTLTQMRHICTNVTFIGFSVCLS